LVTDPHWDDLVYKKMKVAFIITTTVGAMTGVGIWFSAALVSPASIGSLIRVFYWAWFTEWLVFVTEVVLILIYFLTWKSSNASLKAKLRHIKFGWFLSVFSWITMAIIVAILGFMMDPGNWQTDHSLVSGILNPIYLPQLFFRTFAALMIGGVFGMLLTVLFTKKKDSIREKMLSHAARWILLFAPIAILAAFLYWNVLPSAMKENMSTAVGTMEFANYYQLLWYFIIGAGLLSIGFAFIALFKARWIRTYMVIVPFVFVVGFLGIFERVREFIRKPYVIGNYMYSNLLLEKDYPLYQRDGILTYATYSPVATVTEENKVIAGETVFMLTCSRCHTTQGVNSIVYVFERMYGFGKPLDENSMKAYIPMMHRGRTYMPPFPGNEEELGALTAYIKHLQVSGASLEGAQQAGVVANPKFTSSAWRANDSLMVNK
jgi:hypothetical protein